MNKVALGILLAATIGCTASAFAATNGEGQINFTGEIIDSACQVVNGLSNPLNVPLGKVSKTVFTGAGSTSTLTKFDIQLKDCPRRSLLPPLILAVRQIRIITPRWRCRRMPMPRRASRFNSSMHPSNRSVYIRLLSNIH